jgi:hypothetical protein
MTINREREGINSTREDQFFSALGLVKDLDNTVQHNQNLDRRVYEEKYLRYIKSHAATFRPEYPVIIAFEQGNYKLVEKIAGPVIDMLREEKNRVVTKRDAENFSLMISAVEKEKEKAKNKLK